MNLENFLSNIFQDFIRRCLQYRKEERADVFELAKHELFRPRGQVKFFKFITCKGFFLFTKNHIR